MRRTIWGIAAAVLVAGSVAAAEPEGFGDLKWGDPAPQGWKFTPSGESQIHTERARANSLGAARLERAQYEFSGGHLVGAALYAKERSGYLALKKDLEAAYGNPGVSLPIHPAPESCHWEGKTTAADLYYLGEGISCILFLSWLPGSEAPGLPAVSLAERRLRDRLRLCNHLAEALDKSVAAGESQASALGADLDAVSGRPVGGCGGKSDFSADKQTLQQEQRAALTDSQTAASARGPLQKEMDRLQGELEALRARRSAAAQAPPPPATAPVP